MNYPRLIHRLRGKAYDYEGEQATKFDRVLKTAKEMHQNTAEYKADLAKRQGLADERLLRRTS